MDKQDTSALSYSIKKALMMECPDIRDVTVVYGYDKETMAGTLACLMSDLSISSLNVILEKESVLVVKHDYEPLYVMVIAGPGDLLFMLGRRVRQMLAAYERPSSTLTMTLPAVVISETLSRWERSIGIILGEKFAIRLIASVVDARSMSSFTIEDLEEARMRLIGVTGGCLSLKMPPASSFERK